MSNDGITPRKKGVLAFILECEDYARSFILSGCSQAFRILTMWGKESCVRDVAFMRNYILHQLVNTIIVIHANLSLVFFVAMLGGDNKSLQADLFLLEKQRCACCLLPDSAWGGDIHIEKLTIGARVLLFVDSLDSLHALIIEGVVRTWGSVSKPWSILWAWGILKTHAGCNSFPTQVHGNANAHTMILSHIAKRMLLSSDPKQ